MSAKCPQQQQGMGETAKVDALNNRIYNLREGFRGAFATCRLRSKDRSLQNSSAVCPSCVGSEKLHVGQLDVVFGL
jgi:hypothetical protein